MRIAFIMVACLAALPAAAQGVLTRAPSIAEDAAPVYPAAAAAERAGGVVRLELEVAATGEVTDAVVLESPREDLAGAALEAARRLRFDPAEIDGKPAAVRLEYRFTFVAPAPPPQPPAPPVVNLAGIVTRRGDRRPVVGATVDAGGLTAVTDAGGAFAIAGVPPGKVTVVISAPDVQRWETEETIEAGRRTDVRYHVMPVATSPFSAVVVGRRERKEVSQVALQAAEVDRVPGAFGDTVKVLQNLPGISRAAFGSGDLVLRGGDPHDSRVYVDGLWVPQVFHFGGLASVYASALLSEVQYEPGGFGVRYGRATGGRIELKTRDPNFQRLHLEADVDLLDGTALVEGPLTEDLSGAIAFRRSWADVALSAIGSDDVTYSVAPRYYDVQAKLAYRASSRDTVRLDLFGSDDELALVGVEAGGLETAGTVNDGAGFVRAALAWEHRFSADTRFEARAGVGRLTSYQRYGDIEADERYLPFDLRAEVSHRLDDRLQLAAGLDLQSIDARAVLAVPMPPPANELPPPRNDGALLRTTIATWVHMPGAWVEATVKPVPELALVPGLRVDHFSLLDRTWVDPRLGMRWTLSQATVLKGSLGLYRQPPLLQYATEEFGNLDLKPEGAVQASVGIEQRIAGPLSLDLQLYEKRLFDRVVPSSRRIERGGRIVDERYANRGTGDAYGAELLLRWADDGRQLGWIAYSLSASRRSENAYGGGVSITGDELEQPHAFTAVYSVKLPEVWEGLTVGTRVRYTSGTPYRAVLTSVYDSDADRYRAVPAGGFGDRMPAFFQTDVRLEKRWTFDAWTLDTYLDLQNVSNRGNAEAVAYDYRFGQRGFVNGLPILPSIGVRAEY